MALSVLPSVWVLGVPLVPGVAERQAGLRDEPPVLSVAERRAGTPDEPLVLKVTEQQVGLPDDSPVQGAAPVGLPAELPVRDEEASSGSARGGPEEPDAAELRAGFLCESVVLDVTERLGELRREALVLGAFRAAQLAAALAAARDGSRELAWTVLLDADRWAPARAFPASAVLLFALGQPFALGQTAGGAKEPYTMSQADGKLRVPTAAAGLALRIALDWWKLRASAEPVRRLAAYAPHASPPTPEALAAPRFRHARRCS